MTRAGAGVSVLPHFIGRQDGDLVPLLADSIYIRRAFWTVVHRDLAKVARVRAVIDWLKSVTAKRSDLLV
jgi:DNA-binding transcriptional LysR family regulator